MYRFRLNSAFCIILSISITISYAESNALSWINISQYRIPIISALGGLAVGVTITGICAYIIGKKEIQKEHALGKGLFNKMQTEFEATHDKTLYAWSKQVRQLKKDCAALQETATLWHAYYDKSQDTISALHQTTRAQQQEIDALTQQNKEITQQCILLQKKVELYT
ncbi:MAG TPA: hypothetical protein VGW78_00605 [Candidatus Babeliales bacterium]|jgi:hypothetical protein|nr:hypothetical protein [Candidatus Babeliales bacterium]